MGELIVHVGELGQGEMLKLINNALGAANAAALAEALLLARATGVDLDAFVEVTSAGSGASAQMQLKSTPMREHDYTTLFKTAHMLKDVRLCLEESQAAGVPFPSAAPRPQPARAPRWGAATGSRTTPRSSRPPRDSPDGACEQACCA